ncbi:hypothetical protein D1AOALGA4SA_5474 [Olavius algarvensis Delta 1 endosymbiont]|nr:hypothetical protein D1AOALGA4SA_5474 [Olavius algarvensis Delta 1 endosymbiont]
MIQYIQELYLFCLCGSKRIFLPESRFGFHNRLSRRDIGSGRFSDNL